MVQQKASGEAIERLLKRGVAQIEKEADLRRLLLEGNKGQPLRVKLGVDPSHYDLTIGHAVVFCKLRQFQQLGHKTIVVIGDWVLRTACHEARRFRDRGYPEFRVAVNISARQFRDQALIPLVESALSQSGLNPKCLELEITESVAMENIELTLTVLKELREIGV